MAQINALNCDKIYLGLGLGECEIFLKELSTLILVPKSWSIPVADLATFNLEKAIALVQNGTFDPFIDADEFVDNTPDPTNKEYSGGEIATIRNGKPQYSFEFNNGIGFHKAAYSRNSFKRYNALLVDQAGNIVGATSVDGTKFTGLSMGMFNTRTYRPVVGDNTAATIVEIQLNNEEQFNKQMAVLTVSSLGFDFNTEILAIQSVKISGIAEAGNPIGVLVTGANNTIYGIEGLDADNFRVINTATNAVVPITSVSAGISPGQYNITPTTPLVAAQTLRIEMFDATATPPVDTALVDGTNALYKGTSEVITVAA